MRRIRAVVLTLLLIAGQDAPATAEYEAQVITLACDGTLSRANKPSNPEALQGTSVVVNFDEQTVFFLGYTVPIENVDEDSINFAGTQIVDYGFSVSIRGHIDRASGRMDITTRTFDPTKPNDPDIATLRYDVGCEGFVTQ